MVMARFYPAVITAPIIAIGTILFWIFRRRHPISSRRPLYVLYHKHASSLPCPSHDRLPFSYLSMNVLMVSTGLDVRQAFLFSYLM
jgi:hypothetical protein